MSDTRREKLITSFMVAGLTCGLFLVPCRAVNAEELKIGYVDVAEVFDSYQKTKQLDTELEKKGSQKEAELQGRLNELKKLRESLELLNDQARETKGREIEQKADELQRFRNNTARDLRRERDKVAKAILQEIQEAVEVYAKANGFTVILDARTVLYGQTAFDVTASIVKLMNGRSTAQ